MIYPSKSGFLPYKPGALHPVASAPIRAQMCFCLAKRQEPFAIYNRRSDHPVGKKVTPRLSRRSIKESRRVFFRVTLTVSSVLLGFCNEGVGRILAKIRRMLLRRKGSLYGMLKLPV